MVSHLLPWVYTALHALYTVPFVSSAAVAPTPDDGLVRDPVSLVNLFIGTTKGGHTFPGIVKIPRNVYIRLTVQQA